MILRWIYNIWKTIWIMIVVVLVTAIVSAGMVMGALQLSFTKEMLKGEVISAFNKQFHGNLEIDEIGGFLPFRAQVIGGRVYAPSDSTRPVVSFEQASVTVDWWELLLQQNLEISTLLVEKPTVTATMVGDELDLAIAFRQKEEIRSRSLLEPGVPHLFERINIFAPHLAIRDGEIRFDSTVQLPEQLHLPVPLTVDSINATLFLEGTDEMLFADIVHLSAELPGSPYEYLQVAGQFYNDRQYFELNSFWFASAIGEFDFSLEATPVYLLAGQLEEQFKEATYRIDIEEGLFKSEFLRLFIDGIPPFENDLELMLTARGDANEFRLNRFLATLGESSFILSATFHDLLTSDLSYSALLDNVVMHPDEKELLAEHYFSRYDLGRYDLSTFRGELNGNLSETQANLRIETSAGSLHVDGHATHENSTSSGLFAYELLAEVDSLDITPFLPDSLKETVLQGRIALTGSGFGEQAEIKSSLDLTTSTIYGIYFTTLIGELETGANQIVWSLRAEDHEASARADGQIRRLGDVSTGDRPRYAISTDGTFQNVDIPRYTQNFHAETTSLNSTFSINLEGSGLNDLFGRVHFEMDESIIDGDTLRPHQLYADLDSPENENRTLRFTSSFFDGEIQGTILPEELQKLAGHWSSWLQERGTEEILFDREFTIAGHSYPFADDENPIADLSIQINLKDLTLLGNYLPDFPQIASKARFSTTVNASKDHLLITGNVYDEEFNTGTFSLKNFNSSFTAGFRHASPLKEYSTVDIQINSTESSFAGFDFKESYFNLSMRNDSVQVRQRLERLTDDLSLESAFSGTLSPDRFEVLVEHFTLGTSQYNWIAQREPKITYTEEGTIILDHVALQSDYDYIEMNGAFSNNFEDSVEYTVRNLDLGRISNLIGGRLSFSGLMHGEFVTRTLAQVPSIQGEILVEGGRIDNRIIGDVALNSLFNSEENRFDTDVRVYTDPEKYSRYYQRNEGIGQNLNFTGYFKLPDEVGEDEDLFYFDADLNEIDMWIVTFIAPDVFEEMEGRATGTGFIRGTRDDYDFDATFQVHDVYAKPRFTNVDYTLNGELGFTRTDGLLFRDIRIADTRRGTGRLTGQIDLAFLGRSTVLDLTLDLNDLHFMNNPYDPNVPFYSNLSGTGQVRITGATSTPYLRTTRPLALSSSSRISIPLQEETQFDQDQRFIRFVDTFDLSLLAQTPTDTNAEDENGSRSDDLTFIERATMDLQFVADNPVRVRLVFDRVTGEILDADGTGQIRVLLGDQDVSMYGSFNIREGEYNFVSGDIFTRRFTLQEGGSISWQGDLVDASLDITAIYRARPNISSLLGGMSATAPGGQRIPVELVLQIGGTITGIENNFFFRVPTSGIEGTMDPTFITVINNLNQNEDEKLLQATGILLTGNFIPSQDQRQGTGLGDSFSGTSAFLNPLLSTQIISPLLSNQINSLLRSDITFDVDFNINAFNEVDLGVALRLFNDRIILRREGQITGQYSDIGDLGATYRINRIFSLTAFHRQDPTFTLTGSAETRQTQEMNGLGVEAQVQFNTWKSLYQRISNAFRSFLGLGQKQHEEEEREETLVEEYEGQGL